MSSMADQDDDEMHMNATLLPATGSSNYSASEQRTVEDTTITTTNSSGSSNATSGAPRAIRVCQLENPFAAMPQLPSSSNMEMPNVPLVSNRMVPPPMMQQQASVVYPPANATPASDDFVRVSEQCTATKCLRVQWEAESG